jgi:putative transcriptional regulator
VLPDVVFVVANYSGWGPGQLEGEIERDSWRTLPARAEYVFWSGEDDLWEASMGALSARTLFDILGIRGIPADPSMN